MTVKNWLLTLVLAFGACALSFGAFYTLNREPAEGRAALRDGDALEWIRAEFKLSDQQYAAIKQLHERYGSVCNAHCSAIMTAEKRGAPAEEIRALENNCVQSMTEHFQ